MRVAPASPTGPSSAADARNPAPSASTPLLLPPADAGAAASEDVEVDGDAEELHEAATVARARLLGRAAGGDGIGLAAMSESGEIGGEAGQGDGRREEAVGDADQGAENQDPYTQGSWLHVQTDGQGPSGC